MGFKDVLEKYNEIVKTITLSGPTNFAPLIKEAIRIVKDTKEVKIKTHLIYCILLFLLVEIT